MKFILLIIGTAFLLTGIAQTPRITFKDSVLYPEGVAYNNRAKLFYVSSATKAKIGTVDENGNYKVFYNDISLKSTFGMKVDEKRNCLWVCAGDPNHSLYQDSSTYKKMIRLIAVDLTTGAKKKDIDLSNLYAGKHFANDFAMDDKGNIYITDSYSPVIYRVDAEGNATVFAENEMFKGSMIGLNGIAFSPAGYLLTVNSSDGSLLKVNISNPSQVTKVKIKQFFPGGDGLLWDNQNNLVLIQNKGVNKIFKLVSKDNWQSAEVVAATATEDRFQNPSTGTMKDGNIYILNSKLNERDDPTAPPSKEFSIQLALFKPVN